MKQVSLIGNPEVNEDGSISFTMTDGHNDIKVRAIYTEGAGYKINDYEVLLRGVNKDEEPRQT